jgi:hypothetical protein
MQFATPTPLPPSETVATNNVLMPTVLTETPKAKPTKTLTLAPQLPSRKVKIEPHNPVAEPSAPILPTPAPVIEPRVEAPVHKPTNVADAGHFPPSDLNATPSPTAEIPKTLPKTEPTPVAIASNTGEGSEPGAGNVAKASPDPNAWFTPIEKKSFGGQKQNVGIMGAPIPSRERGELASRSGERNKDAR